MTFGKFAVDYEQRIYNPERMRQERLARAQAALKKFGLGSLILFNYDNQRYLGFFSSHQYGRRRPGNYVFLVKDAGFPYITEPPLSEWEEDRMPWFKGKEVLKTSRQFMLIQGYPQKPEFMTVEWDNMAKEIKGLLTEHGLAGDPIGVDMTNVGMVNAFAKAGLKLVDGNHVMATARIIKTQDEIECLRTAGSIAESAHWEVARALRPGVTEWEMAGVAANALYKLGAEEMEGPSFVICSGERSGHDVPNMPTDRVIRPGDMFIIDINGVSFQGYRTCFYRTFVVGDKPTDFQKDVYNSACEGLMTLTGSIKPGISNIDVARNWRAMGKAAGKWGAMPKWPAPGKYYMGSVAHHIGLCSGDPGPMIPGTVPELEASGMPPLKIEKNMCFAVEVGCFVWDGKNWARDGAKIEHCGVVTDTGFEVFYRFPVKDLIACGLPGAY